MPKRLLLAVFALAACAAPPPEETPTLATPGTTPGPAPAVPPAPPATEPGTSAPGAATAAPSTAAERERREAELVAAEQALARDPRNEELLIWYGRRLAYVERYEAAQEAFTRALALHPSSYRALRHRGHRWITLRRFDRAVEDLARAWQLAREHPDAVEPDGQPNAAGIPIGSDHSNIVYHWALAHYLRGEWAEAARVWELGREASAKNDDRRCSSAYWNYLALRRAGEDERAREVLEAAREPLRVLENESYRQLCRLFRGETSAEDVMAGAEPGTVEFATRGYGVACWRRLAGDERGARELLERIVATGPRNAFGCLAAEADLGR